MGANESEFITNDRPATLIWIDPKRKDPLGLSSRESLLFFPVSRKLCIVGAFECEDNARRECDVQRVAAINGHLVWQADRQTY
jgi:hypothetical protein